MTHLRLGKQVKYRFFSLRERPDADPRGVTVGMSRMASVREVNTRYARMNICHLMVSVDLLPCDENHGRVPQDVAYLGTFRMAMIRNVCIRHAMVVMAVHLGHVDLGTSRGCELHESEYVTRNVCNAIRAVINARAPLL